VPSSSEETQRVRRENPRYSTVEYEVVKPPAKRKRVASISEDGDDVGAPETLIVGSSLGT
jgi:hypothetical protein